MGEQVTRHAAEHPLPQAAVAIAAGDDDVGVVLGGEQVQMAAGMADR